MRAFAWFLGLILIGLVSIAVFTYPVWMVLHPYFSFPFHRIGDRIGMLALAVGFLLTARRLRLSDRASLGYGIPRRVFVRELSVGLALGVVTMAAVVGIMSALGLLDWTAAAGFTAAALTKLIAMRLLSGLAVAFHRRDVPARRHADRDRARIWYHSRGDFDRRHLFGHAFLRQLQDTAG